MTRRKAIPAALEADILDRARRRCPICYATNGDRGEKRGQIAHLDRDPSNIDPDNLAFLCLEHHDSFDSKTSQSKGHTTAEVKRFRARLYDWVQRNLPSTQEAKPAESEVSPAVSTASNPRVSKQAGRFDIDELAGVWGVPRREVEKDLASAGTLLNRLREAPLTRTQLRILQTVVEQYKHVGLPRRVVESAASYEYLSSEFFGEVSVLVHFGFLSHDPEMDDLIYLDDAETWATVQDLCERAGIALAEMVRNPDCLALQ